MFRQDWVLLKTKCDDAFIFHSKITNHLFDDNEEGMDLIALNMQRGRDHGLPGYVEYRRACQSGPSNSFEDFSNNMTPEVNY